MVVSERFLTLKAKSKLSTVGFALFYSPIISMVNEWWVTQRGLAFGIITSASGFSLVAMPFIVGR